MMGDHVKQQSSGTMTLSEIREFASFSTKAQRYIRMSLDIAYDKEDALALWSRDYAESAAMIAQQQDYKNLDVLRSLVPPINMSQQGDILLDGHEMFFAHLMTLSSRDIMRGKLDSFAAYRFLYERLLGAHVRPWLPAAFCATASLPQLKPDTRKALLQSISEAAATAVGWSQRAPSFFPEWVEKVDIDY